MNRRLLVLASWDAARLLWLKHDELAVWSNTIEARIRLVRAADFVLRTAPTEADPREFEVNA